jgi:hypothetical protein
MILTAAGRLRPNPDRFCGPFFYLSVSLEAILFPLEGYANRGSLPAQIRLQFQHGDLSYFLKKR